MAQQLNKQLKPVMALLAKIEGMQGLVPLTGPACWASAAGCDSLHSCFELLFVDNNQGTDM